VTLQNGPLAPHIQLVQCLSVGAGHRSFAASHLRLRSWHLSNMQEMSKKPFLSLGKKA